MKNESIINLNTKTNLELRTLAIIFIEDQAYATAKAILKELIARRTASKKVYRTCEVCGIKCKISETNYWCSEKCKQEAIERQQAREEEEIRNEIFKRD